MQLQLSTNNTQTLKKYTYTTSLHNCMIFLAF